MIVPGKTGRDWRVLGLIGVAIFRVQITLVRVVVMKLKENTVISLFQDVPRGVPTRFLKDQSAPQARWISEQEILDCQVLHYDPKNPGKKILLGAIGDQLIGIEDERHIFTDAGSRSGKSVTVIANLKFYQGSIIGFDVKGEFSNKTIEDRIRLGQKVFVIDPLKITRGKATQYRASFNFLKSLTLDNPTLIEDASLLTDAMIVTSGSEKDPHWNESASQFILGLILYVAVSSDVAKQDRHLGVVRSLILKALDADPKTSNYIVPERIFKATQTLNESGYPEIAEVIEGAIKSFYEKAEDERSGILSTVRRHTFFLDFLSIQNIVKGHDLDLEDLKRAPNGITIYIVVPGTRIGLYKRYLRLFVNRLLEAMEKEQAVPKYPVLVILDEFPVLGYMSYLEDAAGQIASFHVKLWVIIQDYGQGKSLYKDRFESFIANAGIVQSFSNTDWTTTDLLSRQLGKTVVEEVTSGQSSNYSLLAEKRSKTLYPLLTPDEISKTFSKNDPLKRQLIQWSGFNPMIIQRVEYFDENGPLAKWLK